MKKIILVLLAFISTGAEAKLSSEKIEKQAENINTVLSVCAFDRSSLDDIKHANLFNLSFKTLSYNKSQEESMVEFSPNRISSGFLKIYFNFSILSE